MKQKSKPLQWKVTVLPNGLFECICPACGNRKEIMGFKRRFNHCKECGTLLRCINPPKPEKKFVAGLELIPRRLREENRKV